MKKQINVCDLNISYTEEGEGENVLILHGWGENKELFAPVSAHLAQKYRVVVPDLPGFGESDEPPCAWSVSDYVTFTQKLIGALSLENAVWLVHSFGGRIAIKSAPDAKYPPRKLILAASAGIKPRRTLKYYIKVYSYKLMKHLLCLTPITKKAYNKLRQGAGSADYKAASDTMRATMSRVVNEDLRQYLPRIKQSTLLVWGDCDTATPISDARLMNSLLPDSGLAVIEGGTHFAFLEQPERFLRIIDYFLEH